MLYCTQGQTESFVFSFKQRALTENRCVVKMLYYLLGVAVIVLLLLAYLFLGSSKKTHVLISGVCDSGKTALFTMLTHKKSAMTFTSLTPNSDQYELKTQVLLSYHVIHFVEDQNAYCG